MMMLMKSNECTEDAHDFCEDDAYDENTDDAEYE